MRRLASSKPATGPEITEDSAALDFAELHRDQLRFDHDAGAWFCRTGSHWRWEGTKLALEWARQLVRRLSQDATAKGRYAIRRTSFASGVERFARGDRAFAVRWDYWDRDPMPLGTPRGTVDLRTGELRAADLMVQLAGHDMLKAKGVALVAASAPTFFVEDTPTAVLVRQVLGAVAQFDKATAVARLAAARRRKSAATGMKCGGQKTYAERDSAMVALAKKLARYPINGRKRSLRDIAAEVEAGGHVNERGKRYAATAISRMLAS